MSWIKAHTIAALTIIVATGCRSRPERTESGLMQQPSTDDLVLWLDTADTGSCEPGLDACIPAWRNRRPAANHEKR